MQHSLQRNPVNNTSTGVQNEKFIKMTVLKPSIYQIHWHSGLIKIMTKQSNNRTFSMEMRCYDFNQIF